MGLGSPPAVLARGSAPNIVSLSPLGGPTAGGTGVTISGTNFSGTVTVTFGGAPAISFIEGSNTAVTATAPAHMVGLLDVAVIVAGGTSANTTADDFTYIDRAPSVRVALSTYRQYVSRSDITQFVAALASVADPYAVISRAGRLAPKTTASRGSVLARGKDRVAALFERAQPLRGVVAHEAQHLQRE